MKKVTLIAALLISFGCANAQEKSTSGKGLSTLFYGEEVWMVSDESVGKVGNSVSLDLWERRTYENAVTYFVPLRRLINCNLKSSVDIAEGTWYVDSALPPRNVSIRLDRLDSVLPYAERRPFSSSLLNAASLAQLKRWCQSSAGVGKQHFYSLAVTNDYDEIMVVRLNTYKMSKNGVAEAWMFTNKFSRTPFMRNNENGVGTSQVVRNGVPLFNDTIVDKTLSMEKVRYECARGRTVTTSLVKYDDSGAVTFSDQRDEASIERSWREVVPGTIGEAIKEGLCEL